MSVLYVTAAELETIKALFNEKEKELAMAVGKVEELTQQLSDVRNGHIKNVNGDNKDNLATMLELEKLRKELMVCTAFLGILRWCHLVPRI